MTVELLSVIVLGVVAVVQAIAISKLEKSHIEKEGALLNRLMARDYQQYVQAEVLKEQVKRPLTPEEIAAMQEERGIVV
jgi:hypothetical protein